jgi:hypothetical protein
MVDTLSKKNRYFIISILLILFTYLLRMWGLISTSLWYDEVFVLTHAQEGPLAAVLGLLKEDNAIPVHGLLAALWLKFAGSGEFPARYLSALLGTVTAPLILRLSGALNREKNGGYWSAVAYATLPIFVYYTQEVRMYALAVPLSAAFAWMGIRLCRTGRNTILYPIVGILMLATHIYTGLLWAVFLIWGFIHVISNQPGQRTQGHFRIWLRSNFWLALGSLPVAIWAIWRLNVDATATSTIPFGVIRWIPVTFGIGQYMSSAWAMGFTMTTILSICIGLVILVYYRDFDTILWIVLSLVLPLVLLFFATLVKAKWSDRYLLPSFGLGLVTSVGVGWELLWNSSNLNRNALLTWGLRIVIIGLVTFWLAGSLQAIFHQAEGTRAFGIQDEWHPRPDFRGVAEYINAHDASDDVVVVIAGYAAHTLNYYYSGQAKLIGLPMNTQVLNTNQIIDLNALQVLETETQDYNKLWLVLWQQHLSDPINLIESILVASCNRLPVNASFTNIGVLRFDLADCRPLDQAMEPAVLLNLAFNAPIILKGYDINKQNELLEISLWWESTDLLDENYSVFVHLVNGKGKIISQHDHIAGANAYPTNQWQAGTYLRNRFFLEAPGDNGEAYMLHIGLYTDEHRLGLKNGQDSIVIKIDE